VEQIPALRELVGYYAVALFALVAQSAACNRMHPMVQRLRARWLLMRRHDRVDAGRVPDDVMTSCRRCSASAGRAFP